MVHRGTEKGNARDKTEGREEEDADKGKKPASKGGTQKNKEHTRRERHVGRKGNKARRIKRETKLKIK